METIFIIFGLFFILRLVSLFLSIRNEKRIIKKGAIQYGKTNSLLLTLAHIAFYFSALYEAYSTESTFNTFSMWGIILMVIAYVTLFYVIYKIRDIWTVKLYILPNHRMEKSFLFEKIKHPNYFLNIIPELIGTALLCNAWYTLMIGFPIYCIFLFIRIYQEDKAMKHLR